MDAAIQPRSHPLDDISRDCQLPLATADIQVDCLSIGYRSYSGEIAGSHWLPLILQVEC
jgi:hypothetical protein